MRKAKRHPTGKFGEFDLHDDVLRSMAIRKLDSKANSSIVDFELVDDSSRTVKTLSFRGTGNIRYVMDFDLLADNSFASTEQATPIKDANKMRRFVRAQFPHGKVKYMRPSPQRKPMVKKLASIQGYTLFRVIFFGGWPEVLATEFSLRSRRARR
jgi:hypothetical protein